MRIIDLKNWLLSVLAVCLLVGCTLSQSARIDYPQAAETIEYYSRIIQLSGYLRSAEELINADQPPDRILNQLFPIESLYSPIAQRLEWSPRFLISLTNLRTRLSVRSFAQKPLLIDQQRQALKQLDTQTDPVSRQHPLSLPARLHVVEQQLLQVAKDYRSALRTPNTVDQAYFDRARGLLFATQERLVDPVRDQLKEINPLLAEQMQSALSTLATSFPVTLTNSPPAQVEQIERTIADFIEASRRLFG